MSVVSPLSGAGFNDPAKLAAMREQSREFELGSARGALGIPRDLFLDLPDLAMRVSDWATGNTEGAKEPIRHTLETLSGKYTDMLNSALGITDEEKDAGPTNAGDIFTGTAAFPLGLAGRAATATTKLGKFASAAGKVLAPTSLPGRLAQGAVVAGAVGGIKDAFAGGNEPTPAGLVPPGLDPPDRTAGLDTPGTIRLPALNLTPPGLDAPDPNELEQRHQDHSDFNWKATGLAIAGVVATALLWKGLKASSVQQLARTAPEIFGHSPEADLFGEGQKFVTRNVDANAPMKIAMKDVDPTAAPLFTDKLQLASTAAVNAKIATLVRDGNYAGSTLQFPSLQKLTNAYVQLTPDLRQTFEQGIYAKSQIADAARGLPYRLFNNWEQALPMLVGQSDAAIRQGIGTLMRTRAAALDAAPELQTLSQGHRTLYQRAAQLLRERNIIDDPTLNDWMERDYMPYQKQPEPKDWLNFKTAMKMTFGKTEEVQPADQFRSLFQRENTDGAGILPVFDSAEQYIRGMTHYIDQNEIRTQFVDAMMNAPGNSIFRGVVSRLTNANAGEMVTIRRAGQVENYKVKDPLLRIVLQMNPGIARTGFENMANMSRRIFQTFTTGVGAPAFAAKGLIYDMWGIGTFADPGMKVSLLRMPALTAKGLASGVGAQMSANMSDFLQTSLAVDGVIPKLLGKAATQQLADRLGNVWRSSLLYKLQSVGGTNATRLVDDGKIGGMISGLKDLAPAYTSKNAVTRNLRSAYTLYHGLFESVQNAARLGYFGAVGGDSPIIDSVRRAAAATRRATGDFAQTGSGDLNSHLSAIFPYYGITMQSLARFGSRLNGPDRLSVLSKVAFGLALPSAAATVYASLGGGKAARDYFWNRLSNAQRSGYHYLPLPGKPANQGLMIPVLPEWRPFHAMIVNAMGAIFNLTNDGIERPELQGYRDGLDGMFGYRSLGDIEAGVTSGLLPNVVPPIAAAGLNMLGAHPITTGAFTPTVANIKPEQLTALDQDGRVQGEWMPQKVEEIITSLLGSTGQAFVHAALAAQQAMQGRNSLGGAVKDAAASLAMDELHSVPAGNMLWGVGERITPNNSIDQMYYDKTKILKTFSQSASKDKMNAGMAGRGYGGMMLPGEAQMALNPDGGPAIARFVDQRVGQIVQRVKMFNSVFQRIYGPQNNSMRQEIQGIQMDNTLSPVEKAKMLNEVNIRIQNMHKNALNFIDATLQQPIDKQFGRRIDLSKIGLDTKIEDFEPVQQGQAAP